LEPLEAQERGDIQKPPTLTSQAPGRLPERGTGMELQMEEGRLPCV
jgi:hypothetical protein